MTRAVLAILLLAASSALAVDWNKPHPHKGVLKPYAAPQALTLNDKEKGTLQNGKAVFRQMEDSSGQGGRGMAVFNVDASPDVVWATICDFAKYPKWIDEVKETKVYNKSPAGPGAENIDVYFKIGRLGVDVEYFIHHVYHHDARWGTWTLDYGKQSDLDDSVGFWRVNAVEGQPNKSVVEYSVDIKVTGWVPGFIRDLLVDSGLKTATKWVKVQSEARARPPQ